MSCSTVLYDIPEAIHDKLNTRLNINQNNSNFSSKMEMRSLFNFNIQVSFAILNNELQRPVCWKKFIFIFKRVRTWRATVAYCFSRRAFRKRTRVNRCLTQLHAQSNFPFPEISCPVCTNAAFFRFPCHFL